MWRKERKGAKPLSGRSLLATVALVALVVAVFGQTVDHLFLNFDDITYIVQNPLVNRGFTSEGFRRAWLPYAFNWHPVTWFSHMLDVQLFGLRPGPQHLVNVGVHALNTVLLFAVLRAMTGAWWRSVLVAALFAAHPLHVESVAWLAERKDLLAACFWLLATAAYLQWTRRPGRPRFAVVAALFAAALAAKPMAVTLPLVLLVLDCWPLGRLHARERSGQTTARALAGLAGEKWPLLFLAAADAVVTFYAQNVGVRQALEPTFALRLHNAIVSCAAYLAGTLWPSGLAALYPFPEGGIPWHRVGAAAALLLGITAWAVLSARRLPAVAAGWAWFLITLLPVIGVFQVGAQARADRYTYLPLVGVFVAAAWAIAAAAARRRLPLTAGVGAACAVAALSIAANLQVRHWRDGESLFRRAIAVTRENWKAHYCLGDALAEQGRAEAAAAQYRLALAVRPAYPEALNSLATVLVDGLNRPAEALPVLSEALRIYPHDATARYNFGLASLQLGRYEDARSAFEHALALTPTDLDARYMLGLALLRLERPREAAGHFEAVLAKEPDYRDARIQLAIARAKAAAGAGQPRTITRQGAGTTV